jgi:hypothetical protein
MFLQNYVNVIWSLKGSKCFHLSTSVIFLHQKLSITLQKVQTASILSWVVVVSLVTSRLPPLKDTPFITMADLLQAVGF